MLIRKLIILSLGFILVACETTRKTETGNIGRTVKPSAEGRFNKIEAAEKRVGYGLTYIKYHNYTRAKFHLDKALEYNPKSGNVHYGLGIYYQRIKEREKAREHFEEALSIDNKKPEYMNAFGAFLCEGGEYKKAEAEFQKAIKVPTYTDIASAFYNIGLCALKQNNIDKADDYFRKALNRDRHRPDALIEMAKIEFIKKRYSRVLDYVRRFESSAATTSESAWLGLKAAHYLRDKDTIAKYGVILEERFPDSEETAEYLDNKRQWM
ncbi:type IV pilus biogenesis/stability protein PilW [Aliikangiella maris]|uniref:Type IV pilus biogenesis/stability protein PilW n=2 Tax=Aliikangiella maris TaxID=3162458 RepID=A0ABV3MQK0_9GAMM